MTNIITISKTGNIKTATVKKVEAKNLYKKCKYRKDTDFKLRNTWKHKDHWVSIYAKDSGRAGSENKYELPPPIACELYFGTMAIIKHTNEPIMSIILFVIFSYLLRSIYLLINILKFIFLFLQIAFLYH